jgi:hypothetical protein
LISKRFVFVDFTTDTKSALGIATIAIITRSIFRAIELSNGFSGEMANNEVLYMILEPPMISLAVIALTLFHPGVCFQGTWSRAKSIYKDGREKLHSKDFSDVETMNALVAGREDGIPLDTFSENV